LLFRVKGHCEALIVELDSPNYTEVGAKTIDLEGNEVDVPGATRKGTGYRYFRPMKFLPILKELFDKPPQSKKEEV
jgi:pre-mRNA-splicing factor ISY1